MCASVLALTFVGATAHAQDTLDVARTLREPGVKLLVVEFYATWCKPCMAAVPKWRELHEKYRKEGLRLIVVATQDPNAGCANPGWNPDQIICDDEGHIASGLGAGSSLPAAFLWSWQGNQLVSRGHVEDVENAIQEWIVEAPRAMLEVTNVAKGAGIEPQELTTMIRGRVASDDKLVIVAGDNERQKLLKIKEDSYKAGRDEAMACELGKDLSANSLLQISIMGRGGKHRLYLTMLSVERGCLVASSVTPWNPDKPHVSVAEGASKLMAKLSRGVQGIRPVSSVLSSQAVATTAAPTPPPKSQPPPPPPREERRPQPRANTPQQLLRNLAAAVRRPPDKRPAPDAAAGMISIPAGTYWRGGGKYGPLRQVKVDAYSIDKREVTAAQYKQCVRARDCRAPRKGRGCTYKRRGQTDHPINCVSWTMARRYCEHVGKRLPTEAEWERAARGQDKRMFPWGDDWPPPRDGGNYGKMRGYRDRYKMTAPTGNFGSDSSPYRVHDLGGNVVEWTADLFDKAYYIKGPTDNPRGPRRGKGRVLKGASWKHKKPIPIVARNRAKEGYVNAMVGFRCAK